MKDIIEQIINLWGEVNRPGIDGLISFLETSDFFTAPCSTKFHLARPGGLAEHSLNVFNLLEEKVARFGLDIPKESIIVCGLGHDLCKVNFYKEGGEPAEGKQLSRAKDLVTTWWNRFSDHEKEALRQIVKKEDEQITISKDHASSIISWLEDGYLPGTMPDFPVVYSVEDNFPLGHGEKSVSVLQDYIPLTEEERLAIRWHMTAFDAGIHFDYPNGYAFRKAAEMYPLVTLLFTADYEASQVLERGK